MKHIGNLTVIAGKELGFPAVSELHGRLTLMAGTHLVTPSLQMVRGWIELMPGSRLEAPHLGRVDGWLTAHSAELMTPQLQSVHEALFVENSNVLVSNADFICGTLHLIGGVPYLPVRSVREHIAIKGLGTDVYLPQLINIGGSLTMYAGTSLRAPKLANVGGYYDIDESATLRTV